MNDFRFDPGLLDEGSNENSFYTGSTQNGRTAHLLQKKQTEGLKQVSSKVADNGGIGVNTGLNHRISMCSVVFGYDEDELKILLLEAQGAEDKFKLVLPGCLATANQTLENSARAMITELSGAENFFMEQVYSFGNPARVSAAGQSDEPNTWEITVAFFALVNIPASPPYNSSAYEPKWYSLSKANSLSPYQNKIVDKALSTLRFEIRHFPIAFELLPEKFTLAQVQSLYQAISGKKLDKRNFRKKLKALNLVSPAGEKIKNVIARPSELFVFNRDIYTDSHNSIL